MNKKLFFIVLSLFAPIISLAAEFSTSYIDSITTGATSILNNLVGLLIGLAVVWFIWNVIKYTMSSDEDGKEKAKSQMVYGIIALAVCVSIWGIVALLQSMFLGNGSQGPQNSSINNMIPVSSGAYNYSSESEALGGE